MLTSENERKLDAFLAQLHDSRELILVSSWKDATDYKRMNVEYSRQTEESIMAKARRPSILARNPSFGIEHVRDTLRFKAVVYSFRDALTFVFLLDKGKQLCPNGLCKESVAKLDVTELMRPLEWGWRVIVFDLIMPNHQVSPPALPRASFL